jgi:hypothetical protein
MVFLTGLLTGVGLLVVLSVALFVGYKLGNKQPSKQSIEPTETEQRQIEELKSQFNEIMNYDFNKAIQRKKV